MPLYQYTATMHDRAGNEVNRFSLMFHSVQRNSDRLEDSAYRSAMGVAHSHGLEYHSIQIASIDMIEDDCEHVDYEETLVDETIWHRTCIDCGKVTEVETKDEPV